MTELHDPLRLMVVIEQFPEVVLDVIKTNPATYQWFKNEWVVLSVIHPLTKKITRFEKGEMEEYVTIGNYNQPLESLENLILNSSQNLPIHRIV
jgi:uncharacterized protein YbcC (UPF0753/DUF2309 family)